jgi:hypothetical protein
MLKGMELILLQARKKKRKKVYKLIKILELNKKQQVAARRGGACRELKEIRRSTGFLANPRGKRHLTETLYLCILLLNLAYSFSLSVFLEDSLLMMLRETSFF